MMTKDYLQRMFLLLLISVLLALPACAQQEEKRIQPQVQKELVKITTRLIEELHYNKPSIDDGVSALLFEEYLEKLDPNRLYFIASDIKKFKGYKYQLDDMLKKGDAKFAFLVYKRFLERMKERVAYVKKTVDNPFDFTGDESILLDRSEEPWAENSRELDKIWSKEIKNQFLQAKLRHTLGKKVKKDMPIENPKKRIARRYERYYDFMMKNDKYDIRQYYLNTLAEIFDPHTSYMNWRTLDDFSISLKLSLEGIGAVLTTDDGYAKVVRIIPGGPADKQGVLKAGYRIIAVGQGDKPTENIIDMPLTKSVQKIRGKKGTKVKLTLIKTLQDVPFDIVITRDKIKLTEQAAKGTLREINIKGGKRTKVGIIRLPSFYADFDALRKNDPNARSTVRDVRKILDKMTKVDKIAGLIIDLRANGGGSLEEVIDLVGLFIPSGPVVQIKTGSSTLVRKDRDHGFFYDVPMVVMVDTFSASASEIFAGAIQDYGRGVIVGQRTYGKGTVQNLLTLDRIGIPPELKPGALKYTMAKFYRITGASTQKKGVTPDLLFPTFFKAKDYGEASMKHVMKWDEISPLEFARSKNDVASAIPALRKSHRKRMAQKPAYKELKHYIERWDKKRNQKTVSLNLEKRLAMKKEDDLWYERMEKMLQNTLDPENTENDKSEDMYLEETIAILRDLLKFGNN